MNRATLMKPEDDVRETPPKLFAAQHVRFNFTLDACATHANAKCGSYFTTEGRFSRGQLVGPYDGLQGSWRGERVWCNPPFSAIGDWVWKAWVSGADLVCMLVPATRTEQPWWQELVEPFRDGGHVTTELKLRVEFLPKRPRFLKDGVVMGSPKFGCCLLVWQ